MKTNSFRALLLAAAISVICLPLAAQVKVWQGTFTLPSYEEGQPDSNPPFDVYQSGRFNYPYTLRMNLTGMKADHSWRAVFLENEYLKCTVLPDIGGHLYTCIDKINGKSMFYDNPSFKKAQIGYRGAWAAFGVEYNFPVSHNWVSISPVDYAYASHEDGSASVWVGNIDRPYGMQWGVELILRPGSTLLEQRVTLYNRSDVRHRYYWWSNAALEVWDDSRIDYPMRYTASHGFTDVSTWPVDGSGKDMSLLKNHIYGPVSRFAHGSYEPFMGIWNPRTEAGAAHYAEHREILAKKIWSWGGDAVGRSFRNFLSDNQSAYVEVQGGLFRNQETYAFLEPGQTIRFSEFWMPVRGTGGISRANKMGVMHFDASGANLSVALNVNERVAGAQVSLTENGSVLWSGSADLTPEKTWSRSVARKAKDEKITFELKDSAGHSLLKQTEGEYDWEPDAKIKTGPQQAVQIPEPAQRTVDDWLLAGQNQELNGEVVLALATYKDALEKFPQSQSLAIAAGRLNAAMQHYDVAEHWLLIAQTRDTPNSEIAYYLGVAEEGLGDTRDAEAAYEIAYRQALMRAPAAIKLGEISARRGDLQEAAIFLKAAAEAEPAAPLALEEWEAVERTLGHDAEADRVAKLVAIADPTSDFIKEDTGKPDEQHLGADPYRVLRVAAEYMRLGLYQKALHLLERSYAAVPADQSEPGSVLPQKHPLVLYYAAYCKQKLGNDAPQNWQAASELSTSLVFPNSEADRMVLEAAVKANTSDGTAQYLLGTLLFSKGMNDEGMAHWTQAKHFAPHLPTLDVDMGDALLKLKVDPQQAQTWFRDGLRDDPDNAEVYSGLDESMSLTGASAAEREAILSQYPSADAADSKMPASLTYQLALTRAEAGQFDKAEALFKGRFFPGQEGEISSGQILFEIKLMQAGSWARGGSCAQAKNFLAGKEPGAILEGRTARDDMKLAAIAQSCGQKKESEEFLRKATAGADFDDKVPVLQAKRSLGLDDAAKEEQQAAELLAADKKILANSSRPGLMSYNIGLLQLILHEKEQARESFRQVLLLPDTHMSHHFAREALAEFATGK